jgi:hypothetical protein
MQTRSTSSGLSLRASLILLAIVLAIAYIGYSALKGAMQVRSDNLALVDDSIRVTGRIIDHELHTDSSAQRTSWYRPVVAYRVDGHDFQVTAQNGAKLTETMTVFKVGTPIDVVYPRGRPADARVVGFEFDSWIGLAIIGLCMMLVPISLFAWGVWRRFLFVIPGRGE